MTTIHKNTKHGKCKTKEYRCWEDILRRCRNKNSPNFHRYGGRGISVCIKWLESFEEFFRDVGPAPTKFHTIDRMDNDKGYFPENVRWATRKTQSNNRSTNRLVEINGVTKNISEWATELGINYQSVHARLRYGWDIVAALTTKANPAGKSFVEGTLVEFRGEFKTVKAWAETYGLKTDTVRQRLRKGFSIEQALLTPITRVKTRNS